MDKKEIENLIMEKEIIYDKIDFLNNKLVESKTVLAYDTEDAWLNTIWEDVIDGRATEKLKKAYVDSHIRETKENLEKYENELTSLYHGIEIINDKLKYLSGVSDD